MKTQHKAETTDMRRHFHTMIQVTDRPHRAGDNTVTYDDAGLPSEIEIIKTGTWKYAFAEPVIIDEAAIDGMVRNFTAMVRKGIALDCDHDMGASTGWITEMRAAYDTQSRYTLYAKVDWTPMGAQLLKDKIYKFFSPEWYDIYEDPESGELYENVLTGGALTNRPLMKSLAPLTASEESLTGDGSDVTLLVESESQTRKGSTMDLTTLRQKDVKDLSPEEAAFLKDNQAELTDDEKGRLGLTEEKPVEEAPVVEETKTEEVAPVEPATANDKGVFVKKEEIDALRRKADEGAQAFNELKAHKAKEKVNGWIASESNKTGKFLPVVEADLVAFYNTLTPKQASEFEALVAKMASVNLFNEMGINAEKDTITDEVQTLDKLANDLVASETAAGREMTYSDAMKRVASEKPDLMSNYKETLDK